MFQDGSGGDRPTRATVRGPPEQGASGATTLSQLYAPNDTQRLRQNARRRHQAKRATTALQSEKLHRPAHSATVPTPGCNTDGHRGVRRSPSRRPVLQPPQSPGRTWLRTCGLEMHHRRRPGKRGPASEETHCRARQPTTAIESTRGITSWFHPFASQWFHVLLNSLFKVLCNFPSRYLFAIGLAVIFSLRWSLPPALGCTLKQPDSSEHRSAHASQPPLWA